MGVCSGRKPKGPCDLGYLRFINSPITRTGEQMSHERTPIAGIGILAAILMTFWIMPWHQVREFATSILKEPDDSFPWLPLDGETLSVQTYPALFQVMRYRYGGDGKSNFALPKLRDEASHDWLANAQFGARLIYRCVATRDLEDHTRAGTMAWCETGKFYHAETK